MPICTDKTLQTSKKSSIKEKRVFFNPLVSKVSSK